MYPCLLKALCLIKNLVIISSCGNANVDITDWSHPCPKPLGYETKLLSAEERQEKVQQLVSSWARQMGLTGHVKVKPTSSMNLLERWAADGNIIACYNNRSHTIIVAPDIITNLATSSGQEFYEGKALICHELGHALNNEKGVMTYDYKEELSADAAVPDEKKVLKAARNLFASHHQAVQAEFDPLGSHPPIDFTKPMDEREAKFWDKVHAKMNDVHKSHFSRAHNFNERYIAVKKQEQVARKQQKCAAFEEHVGNLTTSDILS